MLAWQAIAPTSIQHIRTNYDQLDDNFYNDMYDRVKQSVIGHVNDKWYFLNVHKRNESAPHHGIDTHLNDEGALLVAQWLTDTILEKVLGTQKH